MTVPYAAANGVASRIPERDGYIFRGWAKAVETEDEDGLLEDDDPELFITYDYQNGSDEKSYDTVKVFADERTPYQAFYAVWEEGTEFFIYHSAAPDKAPERVVASAKAPFDITRKVTSGCFYGGYYDYDEDASDKKGGFSDYGPGTAMDTENIPKDQIFYLKEVNENYLKPQLFIVYSNYTRVVSKLYGFVNFDSADDYVSEDGGCGLIVKDVTDPKNVTQTECEITIVGSEIKITKPGTPDRTIGKTNFGNMFGDEEGKLSECFIGYSQIGEDFVQPGRTLELTAFCLTQDGIRVTGSKHRKIQFAEGKYVKFEGWTSAGGNTKTGIETGESTVENMFGNIEDEGKGAGAFGFSPLMYSKELRIDVPEDKITYTVNKFDGTEELDPQTVEAGSHIGEIKYPEKDGYLFAGWFKDEALSTPADFSDVRGDMTVYAGYIPVKDVTLSLARKTGKTGDVTFTATVSVKNTNKFTEVGVSCSHNGELSEEALTKKTYVNVGSTKNPKYTYKFSGPVEVKGLEATDSFTASVYWVTKDGTRVTGAARACTYKGGSVKVQN